MMVVMVMMVVVVMMVMVVMAFGGCTDLFILRVTSFHADTVLTTAHVSMPPFQAYHGDFVQAEEWSLTCHLTVCPSTSPDEFDESRRQFTQEAVEVQYWTSLQILNERRQQVMDLFAAVLQLGRLPYHIHVFVCYLTLHCQKTKNDVALLYYLYSRIVHEPWSPRSKYSPAIDLIPGVRRSLSPRLHMYLSTLDLRGTNSCMIERKLSHSFRLHTTAMIACADDTGIVSELWWSKHAVIAYFASILAYGIETFTLAKRDSSRLQALEMTFQRIKLYKIRNKKVRMEAEIETFLLSHVTTSILQWFRSDNMLACESNTLDSESGYGDGGCQHIGCRYGDSYGIGKTTLIKTVSKLLIDKKVTIAGFYTEEIRNAGKRIGFDVVTLDGKRGILARVMEHVDQSNISRYQVGQYNVNKDSFESLTLPIFSAQECRVLVLDEIGRMELFSDDFKQSVKSALNNPQQVILATIPVAKGRPISFVEEIRQHPNAKVFILLQDKSVLPIVWCREDCNTMPIVCLFIAFIFDFVAPDDIVQLVELYKLLGNIWAKLNTNPSFTGRSSWLLFCAILGKIAFWEASPHFTSEETCVKQSVPRTQKPEIKPWMFLHWRQPGRQINLCRNRDSNLAKCSKESSEELNRPLGDELPISDLEDSDNDGGDADFVLSDHQSDSEQSEVSDSESTDEDGESVPRDVYRGKVQSCWVTVPGPNKSGRGAATHGDTLLSGCFAPFSLFLRRLELRCAWCRDLSRLEERRTILGRFRDSALALRPAPDDKRHSSLIQQDSLQCGHQG
uniref:Uncharacterized protein n=1 Tax=Timema monikensis TaxID=170555 RepID=A0A7R9E7E0_9NEOP|nr:unnamed protein product [Timema monikensis]